MSTSNLTLVHNASQLLTLAGGPQRGPRLGALNLIENGAVVFNEDKIIATGRSAALLERYPEASTFDAQGHVVLPGFVDPHTHLVWAGDRANEFEMRLQGKSYMEIMAAGGGIVATVNATRKATPKELVEQTSERIWQAFRHGTTTAEVKTGYGLELTSELRQLEAILRLNERGPVSLIPTFLGAHAIPAEYTDQPDAYVDEVCEVMLPKVAQWWAAHAQGQPLPFVDVFCEEGAFDLAQSRRILETAQGLGFPLKIHADEFKNLGGAALAASLGAASADHLVRTSDADIEVLAQSDTVAVALPATPFGLNEPDYTPAKKILAANGLLALATDINPGTAWGESMQFILALACRKMGLTPAQAIAAATINAAAALNQADRIGSLEPNKQPDLLILNVSDYRHLGYRFGTNLVAYVVKQGRFYPVT
jgi:imidazolonepropionase